MKPIIAGLPIAFSKIELLKDSIERNKDVTKYNEEYYEV